MVLGDGLRVEDAMRLRELEHTGYDVEVVVTTSPLTSTATSAPRT